jgi:DNA repair protein RadC
MGRRIGSPDDALAYLGAELAGRSLEQLVLLCLDDAHRIIRRVNIDGSRASIEVSVADLVRTIALSRAEGVLIAHNHPSGDCRPSPGDLAFTRSLATCCNAMEVRLHDHLVVSVDGFTSFHREGLL